MNTETTTIAMYTNLKKKQQDFIRMMHRDCEPNETEFTRGELKKIANDNGIAWAPAWIVKDVSRCVKRGTYRVPELAAYRASLTENETDAIDNRERFRESLETATGDMDAEIAEIVDAGMENMTVPA